jgi:hypothetical protein
MDLVLEVGAGQRWAIEIKRGLAPKLERGFHGARQDIQPARSFVVYSGTESYPLGAGVEAMSVWGMAELLANLR